MSRDSEELLVRSVMAETVIAVAMLSCGPRRHAWIRIRRPVGKVT